MLIVFVSENDLSSGQLLDEYYSFVGERFIYFVSRMNKSGNVDINLKN